jgi:hypothetical protein
MSEERFLYRLVIPPDMARTTFLQIVANQEAAAQAGTDYFDGLIDFQWFGGKDAPATIMGASGLEVPGLGLIEEIATQLLKLEEYADKVVIIPSPLNDNT